MKSAIPEKEAQPREAEPSAWPVPGWGVVEILIVYISVMGVVSAFEVWGQRFYQVAAALVAGSNYELGHFFWASLLQSFLIILLIGLTVAWAGRGSWRELGMKLPEPGKLMIYGGLGGLLLLVLVLVFSHLLLFVNPAVDEQLYASMLKKVASTWEFALVLIIGAVAGPVAEEAYFRGMIYPVLRHRWGVAGGVVICGLFFGISHLDLWRMLPLSVGGMILAYIYEKTESIIPCALAHGIWNGVMALLFHYNLL